MRAWPPLQLLFALLFLGGSAFALTLLIGGRDARVPTATVIEGRTAAPQTKPAGESPSGSVELTVQTTAPVRLEEVRWGETGLPVPGESVQSWQISELASGPGPLRIGGVTSPESLPLAIRVEVEGPDAPTVRHLHWVKTSPFRLVIHPSSSRDSE